MKFETDYDVDFGQWIVRLETSVLSEHLAEDYYEVESYYATPRTWWDMFKETYATRWWFYWYSKRWGAPHYEQHTLRNRIKVDRYVNYPEANIIPDPRLGRTYPYERITPL